MGKRSLVLLLQIFVTLSLAVLILCILQTNVLASTSFIYGVYDARHDFSHGTGRKGADGGWEGDYKKDDNGHLLSGLHNPLSLPEADYVAVFHLRRGKYGKHPPCVDSTPIVELKVRDISTGEYIRCTSTDALVSSEIDYGDDRTPTFRRKWNVRGSELPKANEYRVFPLYFTTRGRHSHQFDFRVYWFDQWNTEISRVELYVYHGIISWSPNYIDLAAKAVTFNDNIQQYHLDNGQVLTRKYDYYGPFEDHGDSAIWTGLYVAAQAFRYGSTGDCKALSNMENGLRAMHRLQILDDNGRLDYVARYVFPDGRTWNEVKPKPSSKDTYSGIMFGYGVAYPFIQDPEVRQMVEGDVYRIARHFLDHNFSFIGRGGAENVNLDPDNIPEPKGDKWYEDPRLVYKLLIIFLEGAKEICECDYTFPSELRNGASAIQALHILRVAASVIPGYDTFEQYYYANIYGGKNLIDPAVNLNSSVFDTFITCDPALGGDVAADAVRSNTNHLGYLALYNLIQLEADPSAKAAYQKILEDRWFFVRDEYNALYNFIHASCGSTFSAADARDGIWSLDLFPENRRGTGYDYTGDPSIEKTDLSSVHKFAKYFGDRLDFDDISVPEAMARFPLRLDQRPLDTFIWQRNPRTRLRGDNPDLLYPGVDYLLVYWMGGYHEIIPRQFLPIVPNEPPVANAGGPYTGTEGSPITFNGSSSYDPDGSIIKYDWDLDGDSIFEAAGMIVKRIWPDDHLGPVTLHVTDDCDEVNRNNTTVRVKNVTPTVDAGPDATVNEGQLFEQSGSFTDPGADTWTATVNYGDGTEQQTLTLSGKGFSLNRVYADNDVYLVTVAVTDDDGGSGSDALTLTVNNVAPTVVAGPDRTVNEGATLSLAPSTFNDGGTLDTHTAAIDWGDGNPVENGTVTESPFGPPGSTAGANGTAAFDSHEYGDNGTYTVNVTVTDDDEASTLDTPTVTVNNVAPTATISGDTSPVADCILPGQEVSFDASFADPGWLDTHTAEWNYGDESIVAGTLTEENDKPDATGTVSDKHIYADPGTYIVGLKVTDDDGGLGTDETEVKVMTASEAIDFANGYIQGLEEISFKGQAEQRKRAFNSKFEAVKNEIAAGALVGAINKLQNDIRSKADGSVDGNPKDDWVTDEDVQDTICLMIDELVKYLESLQEKKEKPKVAEAGKKDEGMTKAAPALHGRFGFAAFDAYPQPCNPEVWIPYGLGGEAEVKITIHDAAGHLIRILDLGHKPAGFYTSKDKAAYWNGKNEADEQVASGIYFYTIQAGAFTATKKMILAK